MVHHSKGAPPAGPRTGSAPPVNLIPPSGHPRNVRVLECPQCHGSDLYYEAGLITGYKYHCKTCDYVGAFVIEREIEVPKR